MSTSTNTTPLKLVAKGGIFSLTGDAINYSLSYVFLLVATHFLGPAYLGIYYFAISLSSLLGEFAECGIGQGLMYFGPKFEIEKGADGSLPLLKFALWFTLRNALILAALMFVAAHPVAAFFGKGNSAWLLQLAALCIPCGAFWPILYKYCVARFKIVEGIIYGDILRPILRVTILLFLVFVAPKARALLFCEILVGTALIGIGLYLIYRNWGLKFLTPKAGTPLQKSEKRSLFVYSVPFLPLNLTRGDRVILLITAYFLIPAQIGILGVVLKIAALSQVILTGLNFVFRPLVAKLYAAGDRAGLAAIFKSITRWIFLLTLPISYIMIFYPAAVLSIFGEKFSGGALALVIVAAGYLFEYGTSATQVIINMTGKSWLSLFNQICYFILIATLGSWLIPTYGTTGAALTIAAAIIHINLLRLFQSLQIIKCTPYSPYLLKPIFAAGLAGALCNFIIPIGQNAMGIKFVQLVAAYLLTYGIIVCLLKLHAEDKSLLQTFMRKNPAFAKNNALQNVTI